MEFDSSRVQSTGFTPYYLIQEERTEFDSSGVLGLYLLFIQEERTEFDSSGVVGFFLYYLIQDEKTEFDSPGVLGFLCII